MNKVAVTAWTACGLIGVIAIAVLLLICREITGQYPPPADTVVALLVDVIGPLAPDARNDAIHAWWALKWSLMGCASVGSVWVVVLRTVLR